MVNNSQQVLAYLYHWKNLPWMSSVTLWPLRKI